MVSDKDAQEVFSLLPSDAKFYFCQSSVPRAMNIELLKQLSEPFGFKAQYHVDVKSAVNSAIENSQLHDLILVTGSFFTVADVLKDEKSLF